MVPNGCSTVFRRARIIQGFSSSRRSTASTTCSCWAREIVALGHEVKMMPANYVKAYVKRNKNDAADAEAICKAVTRPTMRFVEIKTVEQQSVLMLHRTRRLTFPPTQPA